MSLPHDEHLRPSRLGVFLAVWGEVIFVAFIGGALALLWWMTP